MRYILGILVLLMLGKIDSAVHAGWTSLHNSEIDPSRGRTDARALKGFTWNLCGKGDWNVVNVTLGPDKITPGTVAHFRIQVMGGSVDVRQGTVEMSVKLAGIPIYVQTDDLCQKTTCPIEKGVETDVVYDEDFPEYTPPGPYTVTLTGKADAFPNILFCVQVDFQVEMATRKSGKILKDVIESLELL